MDRRHFLAGLAIGVGAGAVALSETETVIKTVTTTGGGTLTWGTASDWDNAVSESGVVHESVEYTDHNDYSLPKQGYRIANPYLSADLVGYWPLQEDSGSTAYDFSGNSYVGTIYGATVNVTGLLGASAYNFGVGEQDHVRIPDLSQSGSFTVSCWSKHTSVNNGDLDAEIYFYNPYEIALRDQGDGTFRGYLYDGSSYHYVQDTISNDVWNLWTLRWDGSTLELFKNETSSGTKPVGSAGSSKNSPNNLGVNEYTNGQWFTGNLYDVRVYDRALSASEIQTLYDVVASAGTLTTATKSLSSPVKPDLQNLDYTLNSQTITLDVIGSPGTTSEEVVTQTLGGATSYSLSWSNSHKKFRVRIELSTNDPTVTPTVNQIELVA